MVDIERGGEAEGASVESGAVRTEQRDGGEWMQCVCVCGRGAMVGRERGKRGTIDREGGAPEYCTSSSSACSVQQRGPPQHGGWVQEADKPFE